MRQTHLIVIWLGLALSIACGTRDGEHGAPAAYLPRTIPQLDSAILRSPNDASLFAERARSHQAAKNMQAAINDWKRAILLDGSNPTWHNGLGDLYYAMVDLDNAETHFTKARSLAPDSTAARLKLAEIRLMKGELKEAMAEANDALRLDEQNPKAYFLKGWIHRVAGDTALAVSSYRTATERDPGFYDAYMALARILADQGDTLAGQYFNSVVDMRPNSVEALYARGLYEQQYGSDSIALSDYAKIKTIDPNNPTAWYNTGYIYLEHQDKFAEAREQFSAAIKRMPTYAQAYYNRGLTYEFEGKTDSAAMDFRTALALQPSFDDAALGLDRLQARGLKVLR